MKVRLAKVLLALPTMIVDTISLPVTIINWILTGNFFESFTQQLFEQEDK